MYFLYSILLSIGFLLMLPMFLLRREKYASGFSQRVGNYPEFNYGGDVIWLHCVSVGETNAARPLVARLLEAFPSHRLVISTTTKTGQDLATKLFADKADVIYFPFDWRFSVRRAIEKFKPSIVLLMETEIWPRFIREAKASGAKIAIVNGRLSQKSYSRYSRLRSFLKRVLADVDLALMQTDADADRLKRLGIGFEKVAVTGNLKFEQMVDKSEPALTDEFRSRFAVSLAKPLIIAASTHEPEERYVIESLEGELGISCRLMIAPRHPERFDDVEDLMRKTGHSLVRRSAPPADADARADIILLDSIGELRAAYPLAEIVFVGGSLIPHGGQSVLEPAVAGKAIVTGPYTHNFKSIVEELLAREAIIQLSERAGQSQYVLLLKDVFARLLHGDSERVSIGRSAKSVIEANRGASERIVTLLRN